MEKLNMHTQDVANANIEKIGQLFPNCLTERLDENGKPEKAIDFDKLKQELSKEIVEGNQERYQFTWPGKREAMRLANTPSNMTLRPDRESSMDFDNTENLYIEGDNLEVLKLLRENYLGKVKMIYIDPPYNTGNDFVYEDDFSETAGEFRDKSGMFDADGNMVLDRYSVNSESNGRFHTDWLNMIYPRLKVAKDLLTEDGVIFISIDDNEVDNLRKVCDEIFSPDHFVASFPRLTTKSGKTPISYMVSHDYVLCYIKGKENIFIGETYEDDSYKYSDEYLNERGKYNLKQPLDCNSISYSPSLDYPITHAGITYYPGSNKDAYDKRKNGQYLKNDYAWRWSKELFDFGLKNGWIVFQNGRIYTKGYLKAFIDKSEKGYYIAYRTKERKISTIDFISNDYSNDIAKKQVASYNIDAKFDYPKPVNLISKLLSTYYAKDGIVLDFFSGSATTAEAVFSLNLADGGKRRFILIQLPESLDESNTGNGKYKTICDIAIERIRCAGQKVNADPSARDSVDLFSQNVESKSLDTGFRVLKLDTSNMQDVYYKPEDSSEATLFEDNVKPDRSSEDLLFQVMLECNLPLSAKIEKKTIAGKEVFNVNDGYLLACFDTDVNETVITEVAKQKPYYFVMRDASLSSDNVADNFEQIFNAYSKDTIRKIL